VCDIKKANQAMLGLL